MASPPTLTNADVDRLMQIDIRRTTMLTTWTISLLYVAFDVALRLSIAAQFGALAQLAGWIAGAIWMQVLSFTLGLPLVWLLWFLADLSIVAAGRRSWFFRLGNLAHSQVFLLCYIATLILVGALALQHEVTFSSFWLIFGLLLISSLVGLIEPDVDWAGRFRDSRDRLTLLLRRVPFVGIYISSRRINNRLEQGQAQATTAEPNPSAPTEAPDQRTP